ncbi:hypothetical protein HDU86_002770 [Geranomyces michiganensis]|nr:hypothetical protein HDU86_002770 [Geranomyces michiganensis]
MVFEVAELQPDGLAHACARNEPLLASVSDLCDRMEKLLSTEEAAIVDRKRALAGLWADVNELRIRHMTRKPPVFKIMGLEFPLPENDSLSISQSSVDSPILSPLSYLPSPLSLADTGKQCTARAGKDSDLGRTLSPTDAIIPHLRGRSKVQSMPPPPPPELQAYGPGSYIWSPTAETLAGLADTAGGGAAVRATSDNEVLDAEAGHTGHGKAAKRAGSLLGRAKSLRNLLANKNQPKASTAGTPGWKLWKT